MKRLRPAASRGNPRGEFINSRRTFSFPGYWDPRYMNWGVLETINDDRVTGIWQVPWHRHEAMEIFGYVVEGSCHHVDSLGNDREITAGSVQRMSAGTGIEHTEGNSTTEANRYLQLWIRPDRPGGEPRYDVYRFSQEDRDNRFCDVTSCLPIRQAARLWSGLFNRPYLWALEPSRGYYVYVVEGSAVICDLVMQEGDGLALEEETLFSIDQPAALHVIVFDLPAETKA